jgi:hypothetical protein
MILARGCSLHPVVAYLADGLEQPELSVRSRLREWYLPATLKKSDSQRGGNRRELDVATCFAPLLRWLRRDWPAPRLPLALDAAPLDERFVLRAIRVLYRRCAVPVAGKIRPAHRPGAWKPPWLDLRAARGGVVPPDGLVGGLADRGLGARWLFRKIQSLSWHPLRRINRGGRFRLDTQTTCGPLKHLVPQGGMRRTVRGPAFATPGRHVAGTLVGWWGSGHKEPGRILSDLAPPQGDASG